MSNLPALPISDIERMAAAVAKSGLFGMKTPDQAMALMLIAQAEGMHPALAARDYHVIQGRPALKADAMLARFQAAGGTVKWTSYTDDKVAGVFAHPQGGSVEVAWTIAQAKNANLTGKDVWKQYPRQMLRARVISEGIRTVFPGVLVGTYTPEEIQDMEQPAQPAMRDVTPAPAPEPEVIEPTPAPRPFAIIDSEGNEHTYEKGGDYLKALKEMFDAAPDKVGFWDSNKDHFLSWQTMLVQRSEKSPKTKAAADEFCRVGREIVDVVFDLTKDAA